MVPCARTAWHPASAATLTLARCMFLYAALDIGYLPPWATSVEYVTRDIVHRLAYCGAGGGEGKH